MDAISVVSVVIKKLQGLLPADGNTTSNIDPAVFQKQVRDAINSLDSLKQFLKDEDDREASSGHSSMDDQEVAQLLRAVYSADDALNTLILEKELREQPDTRSGTIRKLMRFMKNLISRKGMGKVNKKIRRLDRLVEMKEKAVTSDTSFSTVGIGGGRHSSGWQDRRSRISDFCLEEEADVDVANELLVRLVPYQFPKLIAVIGEGGSGKTTLARTIYDRVDVRRYFTKRAWIQVPSLFNATQVLGDILQQINEAELVEESTLSEDELMWIIIKLLNGARCLIVLEDVETPQILETVINPLCNKSLFDTRLILSTSNANKLPPETGSLALHLGRLNEEESWKLFLNKVRMKEDEVVNSELISLKEEILKICGGLPSAIVLLAGLLYTKGRRYDDWYRVIESASNNKGDILALSYEDLPPEIKPCFLYTGIFPKKVEIPVRRLIHLWVAEGFVIPLLDPEETNHEEMAGRCFEVLVIRNMIQVVRRKSDGSPKTCYMPGVLYDFFSSKAEAAGFFNRQFHTSSNKNPELAAVRRLATYSGIKNLQSSLFVHVHRNLRSYVAYDTRIRCSPSIETEHHDKLQELYLLGTLPGERFSDCIPPNLRKLTLSMSRVGIDPMPLLGQLPHLNVLRLLSNSIMVERLTCSAGGFPKLRLLKLWHHNYWNPILLTVEEEAMSSLNELEIRDCNMLPPRGLEYVITLKEITLTNMPDTFRKDVEKIIQGRNVYIKNNTCPSSSFKEYNSESEDEDM
ncbi:hypothetical protein Ddye_012567 [Dipteronia dyeriana]|uniref:NB-ARC domain-containing protein n=1 Tax=Dipteronia dyeriana TaxID=168575 RepID=A0AAD9X4K8_9ROSI|nr:hypothetical protein Ddye_012567 [Dipteronia dyeriana]